MPLLSAAEGSTASDTRCWTVHTSAGAVDVQISARDDDGLEAVLPALRRLIASTASTDTDSTDTASDAASTDIESTELWSGSTRLPNELPLTAPELAHGSVLGLGRAGPRAADRRSGAVELHVIGGPDAGRTVVLEQGRHVLGRGTGAAIRLRDPVLSRRHAVIEVANGALTVADLGSCNGTRLDDLPVGSTAVPWGEGTLVRVGASTARVTGPASAPVEVGLGSAGRTLVRPAPRLATAREPVEIVFPRAPDPPAQRHLPWAATALPAVAGVIMALLLHTPTFLFFAVLGPVVGVTSWLSDRWTGRRSARRDGLAHAVAMADAHMRLEEAVYADVRAADTALPDLARLARAARRRCEPLWSRRRDDADALTVRLGTGPGPTGVTRVDGDGRRCRQPHDHVPVALDLRTSGGLAVVGPRSCAVPVLAGVIAQLATLHAPGEVDLLLVADPDRLSDWAWMRWLPHLGPQVASMTGDREEERVDGVLAARQGGGPAAGWLVVIVDGHIEPGRAARLRAARPDGVLVLSTATRPEGLAIDVGAVLTTVGEVGEGALLAIDGAADGTVLVVDQFREDTVVALARDLASLDPVRPGGALPHHVGLLDIPGNGLRWQGTDDLAGEWSRSRSTLTATVGWTESGPLRLDLCREGPHALVAGTTGSGKSELLQTLIVGLALEHPPDRCAFLLVDYKGGAAFAEAAVLPHTVGMLTDLDGHATARALRSLSAELSRRETLLAAHRVADLADLPDEADLPRLVIVVDEFATLADELPSFVPGLVGIAQRGRSLGVHLVLATQRPSGVVSPEIRANCTLRICLRTTDEADSRDVLGTPEAAHLPVDLPGRAFARTGSGSPVPFQVARVSAPDVEHRPPAVRRWAWPQGTCGSPLQQPRAARTQLNRLTGAIGRHAASTGVPAPRRPWLPPLPHRIAAEELPSAAGRRIVLGLVDRPDLQTQEPLELDLDRGGAWLAVGGPRSGRTTLLRAVLTGAVSAWPPDDVHVHVLDHGGGALAREAESLPHAGTCLGGEDSFRTVRLLHRLAREVSARRSGASNGPLPRVLLLVDGAESVMEQLDEHDPTAGSAALLRLVREGAAVGLTCVLTADRVVPGGRLSAVASERLVLPLGDRADYAVAGVPAAAVPTSRPPGRALLGDEALEAQLVLPTTGPSGPEQHLLLPGSAPPLRIADLPADPFLDDGPGSGPAPGDPAAGGLLLAVGPGGDEGEVQSVDLSRTGGLLVVGPPGSGRTAVLTAFGHDLSRRAVPVLWVAHHPPEAHLRRQGVTVVDPRDVVRATEWLERVPADAVTVVVADDVGPLPEWPVLSHLWSAGARRSPVLVAAGAAGDLAGHYTGAVASLRRNRSGLLLSPGPVEADVLGVRLPRTPLPVRPGSGWLVSGAHVERVQVARRRRSPASVLGPSTNRPEPAGAR